jgi:sugar-specific transcriptional regulator TrmB
MNHGYTSDCYTNYNKLVLNYLLWQTHNNIKITHDILSMKEEEILEEIGLERREARIYLMMLRYGSSTASKVADRAEVDRTTTYTILERLMKRGLASYIIRNNVKYFQAAPPEQILTDMREMERKVETILPHLNALSKSAKEETSVEVFKGREGIRTLYKMMINDGKDYYWMGGGAESCSRFPKETETFVKKANAKGMKGKLIFRETEEFFVGSGETYRLIPREYLSSITTTIWGDKTGVFVWSEPFFAIVIESKEVADSNRGTFDFMWEVGKKPSAEHMKAALVK